MLTHSKIQPQRMRNIAARIKILRHPNESIIRRFNRFTDALASLLNFKSYEHKPLGYAFTNPCCSHVTR